MAISFASMRAFPDYDGPFLDGAAYGRGLQPDVEPDGWSERRSGPSAAVRRTKADDSEGSYRPTCTRAAHHERQATRFQRGHIAEFWHRVIGLGTFQDRDICCGIAA